MTMTASTRFVQSTASSLFVILLFTVLSMIILVAIVRRQGWVWAAPYLIGAGIMAGIGVLGALFLNSIKQLGPEYIQTVPFPTAVTLSIIAVSIPAFALGSLLGLGRRPQTLTGATDRFTGIRVTDPRRRTRVVRGSLWISWFTVAVLVIGIGGPAAVLERSGYLEYTGPKIMAIGNVFELVSVALLGFSRQIARPGQRAWCTFLIAVLTVIAFSTGSRRLALMPLLVWLGGLLAARQKRRFVALPILSLLALVLAGVALFNRKQPGSGLLPYLNAVVTHPGDVLTGFGTQLANGMALFAGTGYAATRPPVSAAAIAYSLTPSPRGVVNANNVGPGLILSVHHPSPAVGILYSWGGPVAVFVYMFIAGLILGAAGRLARRMSEGAASVGAVVITTVCAYFCLRALQYTLRTETRLLWYILAATILVRVLTVLTRRRRAGPTTSTANPVQRSPAAATRKPLQPTAHRGGISPALPARAQLTDRFAP